MLSGESAMGKYPEGAVAMLAKIAAFTVSHQSPAQHSNLAMLVAGPSACNPDANHRLEFLRIDK